MHQSQGIYPDDWKVAKVSPIHRSESSSNTNNFRPFSMLPGCGIKQFVEKIIFCQGTNLVLDHYARQ